MKSVGLKKRPKKNLCISEKSVGQNFHRISRMNRRQSCYRITHGFARIFGRWPMARARYVLLLFLVTQISLMTQIFLRGRVWSHRFHRFTQIFLNLRRIALSDLRGYLFFVGLFLSHRFHRYTQIFMESLMNRFVRSQGVSATTEQVASAKFRVIR